MKCPDLKGTVWWVLTNTHTKHTKPPRHKTFSSPRKHPLPCSQRQLWHWFLAPLINCVCSKNSYERNHTTFKDEHEWWARTGKSSGKEKQLYTGALENNLAVLQKVTQTPYDPATPLVGVQTQERGTPKSTPNLVHLSSIIHNSKMDKLSVHQLTNEQNVYIYPHSGTLSGHHKELRTDIRDEMTWMNLETIMPSEKPGHKRPHTKLHAISHLNLTIFVRGGSRGDSAETEDFAEQNSRVTVKPGLSGSSPCFWP